MLFQKVRVSIELKNQLQSLIVNQLTPIITCGEAWFYLTYYDDAAWVEVGKKLAKPKRLMNDRKIMVFTAFSTSGIVLVKTIPLKTSFNNTTMCQTILPLLNESVSNHDEIKKNLRCRIHLDYAHPHTSKITKSKIAQLRLIQLPQPPFSPDVSHNDFFLYGMLKGPLKGRSYETFDDLLNSIDEILSEIPKETWEAVYNEWAALIHSRL